MRQEDCKFKVSAGNSVRPAVSQQPIRMLENETRCEGPGLCCRLRKEKDSGKAQVEEEEEARGKGVRGAVQGWSDA